MCSRIRGGVGEEEEEAEEESLMSSFNVTHGGRVRASASERSVGEDLRMRRDVTPLPPPPAPRGPRDQAIGSTRPCSRLFPNGLSRSSSRFVKTARITPAWAEHCQRSAVAGGPRRAFNNGEAVFLHPEVDGSALAPMSERDPFLEEAEGNLGGSAHFPALTAKSNSQVKGSQEQLSRGSSCSSP